jgi:microcystin-dependent protein
MKTALITLAGAIALLSTSNSHATCSTTPYLGSMCVTAASYCPRNYAEANGQTLAIANYQALFAILGTTFGGNGTTGFQLPDMRGRTAVGVGEGIGLSSVALGQTRGQEKTVLSSAHMPPHTHQAEFEGESQTINITYSDAYIPIYADSGSNTTTPSGPTNITASPGGPSAAAIWSPGAGAPIGSVDGMAFSSGLVTTTAEGSVGVESTGQSLPIWTVPPQLGLRYCIATQGVFPPRS